jgi:hypothetical protein
MRAWLSTGCGRALIQRVRSSVRSCSHGHQNLYRVEVYGSTVFMQHECMCSSRHAIKAILRECRAKRASEYTARIWLETRQNSPKARIQLACSPHSLLTQRHRMRSTGMLNMHAPVGTTFAHATFHSIGSLTHMHTCNNNSYTHATTQPSPRHSLSTA